MNYNNIILPELSLEESQIKKKPHVHIACNNCKKAHLACDESRPCHRCRITDKADSCQNTKHKKRGRPKLPKDELTKKAKKLNVMIPELVNSTFSSTQSKEVSSMLTIFITLDLCCARASNESIDFLDLYPQELSQRSIYDFILPGEEERVAKIHNHLLHNVTRQHKIPNNVLCSSSDLFYSTPTKKLLDIANGSQTFKQTIKFRHKEREQEMNTSFYLGGGLGADLLDATSLNRLYIVCVLSPTRAQKTGKNDPLREQERTSVSPVSPSQSDHLKGKFDLFQKKSASQQNESHNVHPNELYYFQTTSSRLSSDAMARTSDLYLSGTNLVNTNISFSPLAKYNNMSNSL
ncbi:hypothetical protein G6F16_011589 [Rhizopus arrhizus]|nr:hypothetical protein G6F21_011272 [Rhizopus arrhizus]KAG0783317.1 hypothetical protein G6F22_008732 [Rhizopus arrhizus]KAG0805977.1 hypothetical protein G6F20_011485 [Rhizopus arrhizus]KAG0823483.1 hypothetical protein G6F18_011293 [Rhizopus arrhizus]KAG0826301.1 hypothetical protein G6F19_009362 [Rhizopus arrhizus]